MRAVLIILFALVAPFASARELPWMGVSLKDAENGRSEKLSLPKGVGLEVSRIAFGGPAAGAGTRIGDFWWKIDGQILINKSQMLVLLRSKNPGEIVTVDFYRDGKLGNLELTLGNRGQRKLIPVSFRNETPGGARFLAKREKVARVQVEGRDLSLENEGDQFRFRIKKDGVTVLSALVSDEEIDDRIPVKWQHSFIILRMTLGMATAPPGLPGKKRVRYIPRAKTSVE